MVVGFNDVYGLAIRCPGVGWVVLRSSAAKHHDFGLGHVKGVPPLVCIFFRDVQHFLKVTWR